MHRKIEETPEREKMLIRLKELRLERGYSMTQAARKIFSHPDTYNRYEKGIRENARRINKAFSWNGNSSLSDND